MRLSNTKSGALWLVLPRRMHPMPCLTIAILAFYGWSSVLLKYSSLSLPRELNNPLRQSQRGVVLVDSKTNLEGILDNPCERVENRELWSIWTFPTQPPRNIEHSCPNVHEVMVCAYTPCFEAFNRTRNKAVDVNLRSLAAGTNYEDFVSDHMFYKVNHGTDYLYHVQFVTMLLMANKTEGNVCVRTIGDDLDAVICKEDVDILYKIHDPTNNPRPPPILNERSTSITSNVFYDKFNILDYEHHRGRAFANTGDDLQVLPGVQFMPYVNGFVSRADGVPKANGHLMLNAWWGYSAEFPPDLNKSDVAMFSMHMSGKMRTVTIPTVQDWFVNYSRQVGPIGARDIGTLEFLQELGIKSYLSSCFTLTLNLGQRNKIHARDKIVVADAAFTDEVLPAVLQNDSNVVQVTPKFPSHLNTGRVARFKYVETLLKTHARKAKVIITSRIHVALPGAAQGVPVIFVNPANERTLPGGAGGRTEGISDLFHEYWPDTDQPWDFDLDNMPANPGVHRMDRYRASFWHYLKTRGPQVYSDTAKFYGIIPMQRLGDGVSFDLEPMHDRFHFVVTKPATAITWHDIRSVENLFYHHPNARVLIHSNSIPAIGSPFDIFRECGYNLNVQKYDMQQLMKPILMGKKKDAVQAVRDSQNELRRIVAQHLILHKYGGVSLDLSTYFVKPMPLSMNNVAVQNHENLEVSDAPGPMMAFEKGSAVLKSWIIDAMDGLSTDLSAGKALSADSLPRTYDMKRDIFMSLSRNATLECFHYQQIDDPHLFQNVTAVQLVVDNSSPFASTVHGTLCDELLTKYCIFCDEMHTAD